MSELLTIVAGTVSELVVHRGEEEFVRSEANRAAGAGAAVGLAAGGLAGSAVGASIATTAGGDPVEFFSCKVDGRKVHGRFSRASFVDGDFVEFVVVHQEATALAARRSHSRTIWMTPHHSRGSRAHARHALVVLAWLTVLAPGFFVCLGLAISWFSRFVISSAAEVTRDDLLFLSGIGASLGVIAAPYVAIRFYYQWRPIARRAESIFAALGYPNPALVDLPRDHKRYCKANGIKWPYLTDGNWIYHYIDSRERPATIRRGAV